MARFRPFFLPLLLAASSIAAAQSSGPSIRPTVRVTAKIDRTVQTTLAGTHPAVLGRAIIGSRLSASTRLEHMILVLKPSDEQEAALHSLLDAQQDKTSASFHQWLTPDNFNASFGVASSDIAQVSAWLGDSGLSVESVARSGRFITFSGTVGSVESAFNTEMHNVTVDGEAHVSNTTDVSIPSALAPVVKGVKSLNDFFPKAHAVGARKITLQKNAAGGYDSIDPLYGSSPTGTHYVAPGDIATIFNATPLTSAGTTGKGVTISVLARSNIQLADVEAYRSLFGLPKNDPNIIVVGSDPGENADDVEAFLDAEMAGSLATDATVNFIVSSASLIGSGIDTSGLYAVDNNIGDVITLSYGGCEASNGQSGTAFWNDLWEEAAAQGQTAFVSSGDSSAAGCDSSSNAYATGGYAVNGLGSSAYNVAVGGSMFVDFGPAQYWGASTSIPYATALSYIPEAPWNQGRLTTTYLNSASTATVTGSGIAGGGGGISIYTARPSWQTGSGIPTSSDAINVYSGTGIASGSPITGLHRLVPDVSLIAASGHDGTLFCYEGICNENGTGGLANAGVVGGTSVAAPTMASVQALIDSANGGRQGNANFYYYPLANQQYTASTTACAAKLGTAANPSVALPASTCNFHDIVTGSNIVPTASSGTAGIGFSAGAGFDEASGLGSVNIANLANNWKNVVFRSTTTTFSLTPTSITHGSSQTASIQVTASSGGTPTGDVSIIASQETAYGSPQLFTLSGGSVQGTVNSLPAGTYSVYAHYAGDGTYASSDSNPVSVTITKEGSSTLVTPYLITAGGAVTGTNSFTYGSGEIYIDTEIGPDSGNGTASGSVIYTVKQNGVTLSSLTTKLDTYGTTYLLAGPPYPSFYLVPNYPTLTPGTYTVTSAYSGDTSFNNSSASTSFTVAKATPSVSFTASTAQITASATATLNFTVTTPASATPASGTVVFTDTTTGAVLGSASLSNGKVSFSTTGISTSGAHTISATYSGDNNYNGATPSSVTVTVTSTAATTTTLTSTTSAPSVGSSVALMATVSPVPTASALVYFYDGGQLLGSATASTATGVASLTVTSFTAGLHSLTAKYAGNSTELTSTGSLSLNIAMNATSVLISGGETSAYGQTVSFNGYISRSPNTTSVPAVPLTGVVNFYDGGSTNGTLIGSATPVFGPGGGRYVATLNISTLGVGSHSIVASYPGDANYAGSTSVTAPLTVTQATPAILVSPVSITYGSTPTTLTASVTSTGSLAPTGALTFTVDGGPAVTASCTGTSPRTCMASYPTGTLAVGTHTITATEAADTNYAIVSGTGTLTVTAAPNGTPVVAAMGSITQQTGGSYVVTITVSNTGNGVAPSVTLNTVTLGGVSAAPLPQSLGTIQPGNSVVTTVSVPASAGPAGNTVLLKMTGSYTGGNYTTNGRATLP
jgi:hypothetical protein